MSEFAVAELATALGHERRVGSEPARAGPRAVFPAPAGLGAGPGRVAGAVAGAADRRGDPRTLPRGGGVGGRPGGAVRAQDRPGADPAAGRGRDRTVHARAPRPSCASGPPRDGTSTSTSTRSPSPAPARIDAELDLADALDLDDALRAGAAQLAAFGNSESLDVRRSVAAGDLARRQLALGFPTEAGQRSGESGGGPPTPSPGRFVRGREVVLHVHLTEEALRGGRPDLPVWLEEAGGRLLTAGQVATWCGLPDTAKVTVKPVVDLNQPAAVDGYRVPARIAEQVRLRDRTCVHPYCQRPARCCDLDHVHPYDPDGPAGQTSTGNLACLCRLHHRMKTHAGWTYTMLEPGVFLWRGPHGHTWLRDPHGTTDLTPDPADPPPRRTS